jgi:hypothetical protein
VHLAVATFEVYLVEKVVEATTMTQHRSIGELAAVAKSGMGMEMAGVVVAAVAVVVVVGHAIVVAVECSALGQSAQHCQS